MTTLIDQTKKSILFLGAICVLFLVGCKSKDPNPELKDPIYNDLQKEYSIRSKAAEEAMKKLVQAEKELASVEPRSLDRKIKLGEVQKAREAVTASEQMAEYYRIRADLRKVYARKEYAIAFQKGEEWPNPKEFDAYKTNKRLRDAPSNWSHRVPKPGAPAPETAAAASGGGH